MNIARCEYCGRYDPRPSAGTCDGCGAPLSMRFVASDFHWNPVRHRTGFYWSTVSTAAYTTAVSNGFFWDGKKK